MSCQGTKLAEEEYEVSIDDFTWDTSSGMITDVSLSCNNEEANTYLQNQEVKDGFIDALNAGLSEP